MKPTEEAEQHRNQADLENTETILEYALGSYQRSTDNFNALDAKASTFAGFIGLVLTLAGGLWSVQNNPPAPVATSALTLAGQMLYSASVLALAAAFLFCLLTLRARNNVNPPLTEDVVSCYVELGAPESRRRALLKRLVVTLQEADKSRTINNRAKSTHLQRATGLMFWALAFGMAGYVVQIARVFGTFGGALQ